MTAAKRKKDLEEMGPVTLTPTAIERVKVAAEREQSKGKGLRIRLVEVPGGFRYDILFEDTESAGDHVSVQDGLTVYVDRIASKHLQGTIIDFVETSPEWGGFLFQAKNASS